jgi:peptidoglycan/LPS O-acetylase OafA/YrhL
LAKLETSVNPAPLASSDRLGLGPGAERRPELDGLRAIAIAFVLLGHFDLAPFDGGFAGVDVFFVLSGFLITAQCARSRDALPWRQIGAFYLRRFWRIAPAYLVVVAATVMIGAHMMLADDARRLETSALASALFAANIYFNNDLGYFAPSAIYSPLLHLWSLGVEAQFYLVWPIALRLALPRPTAKRLAIVAAIAAVSFLLSLAWSFFDAKTAFFSLPSRLWEFVLGGAIALAPAFADRLAGWRFAGHAGLLALAALLAAPFVIDGDMAWPAPAALMVTVPTAVVILCARDAGWARRLLSLPPIVWLGQISYSLYLVHWPLVTLATYAIFPEASAAMRVALLGVSLLLAWGLHVAIETPFRAAYRSPGLRRGAALGAAGALALGVGPWLCGLETAARAPAVAQPDDPAAACRALAGWSGPPGEACLSGGGDGPPVVALWGDSHAGQLAPGFAHAYAARGETLLAFTKPSCPPLPGVRVSTNLLNAHAECEKDNARALAYLLAAPSIKTVFLAGRWAAYADANRFGRETGGRYYLTDAARSLPSVATSRVVMRDSLIAVTRALSEAGKTVILVAQTPEMGFDAGRCFRLLDAASAAQRCAVARASVVARRRSADAIIAAVRAAAPVLHVVDPLPAMCDSERCEAVSNGVGLYRDFHHLSEAGADRLVPALLREAGSD